MSEPAVRTRWAELDEVENMARQLTLTALSLSPGLERHDSPLVIRQLSAAHSRHETNRV
jgi:hypothetical protein